MSEPTSSEFTAHDPNPERRQASLSQLLKYAQGMANMGHRQILNPNISTLQSGNDFIDFWGVSRHMPDSILEITQNSRFADHQFDTETHYAFTRNNDGDLMLFVSDVISLKRLNEAIDAMGEVDDVSDADLELNERFNELGNKAVEEHEFTEFEAGFSMHPASYAEAAMLREALMMAERSGERKFSPKDVTAEQIEYLAAILTETPAPRKTRLQKIAGSVMRHMPGKKPKS